MYTPRMTRTAQPPSTTSEHTWKRRAFHLGAALVIPVVALAFGYRPAVYLASITAAALAAGEAVRLIVPAINVRLLALLGPLFKAREKRSPTAATYLALTSLAALFLFGREIAALALLFTALGDPAAGIIGARYGRRRLQILGRRIGTKSVEGTLAFIAASTAVALGMWAAGVYGTLWTGLAGAAIAALVEFLPIPVEDNVTVPLASATIMWLLWVA